MRAGPCWRNPLEWPTTWALLRPTPSAATWRASGTASVACVRTAARVAPFTIPTRRCVVAHRLDKGRSTVDAVTIQKSLKIGVGGTDLKKLVVYSVTLSPAAVAANTTAEQTFTVTGVAVGEDVLEAVET